MTPQPALPAQLRRRPTIERGARLTRATTRTGTLRRRPSDLARCGRWLEPAILILYACLLYKLAALGILVMAIMALALVPLRGHAWPIRWTIPALAIAYTAMATITALRVDVNGGITRTLQFALAAAAAAAAAKYLAIIDDERRRRFFRLFAILNGAVLVHLILFHVTHGHIVTWKYLLDTKFVLSMIVILCFFYEDDLRARGVSLWYSALFAMTIIILMSGERKAYLLLGAAFLLSRETVRAKLLTGGSVAAAIGIFAALEPNSYIVHQLSGSEDYGAVSNRYFLSQTNLKDHSDAIRTFVNRNAFQLFQQHPLIGTGSTGYLAWSRKTYGSLSQSHGLSMNVHGEVYRVLAEGGLVGAAIALAFLAGFAAACLASIRHGYGTVGHASARTRTPIYLLLMMIFYLSSEAMDTTMLLLILFGGFLAGSIAQQAGEARPVSRRETRLRQYVRA